MSDKIEDKMALKQCLVLYGKITAYVMGHPKLRRVCLKLIVLKSKMKIGQLKSIQGIIEMVVKGRHQLEKQCHRSITAGNGMLEEAS